MRKRRMLRFLFATLLIYLAGAIILYMFQENILFHPKHLHKEYVFSFKEPFEEINIPYQQHNLNIIKFKTGNCKGIVLFYHGNMKNVEHYKKYPAYFLRNNYEVWMIDYPGFGKSTGKRSEKIMNEQALLMYDMVSKEMKSDSIVIYGKSIGTGVASYVASNRNCKQLILETPYYSISSLSKQYFPIYPVTMLLKYSFPVHNYLKKIQAPIVIFHGTKDEVVPYKHSKWLNEEDKNLELVTIQNGRHNNLSNFDLYQRKIDSLLLK